MGVNIKRIPPLLILIGFLVVNSISPVVSAAPTTSITITSDTSTDLGEISTLHANVTRVLTITYAHSGVFFPEGSFLRLLVANKRTPTAVSLSVSSAPEWCTVSLLDSNFSMPIGRFLRSEEIPKSTTMTVYADITDVKAKSEGIITFQADATVNGKLQAVSTTVDFSISVDFIPSLDVEIIEDVTTPLSSNEWGNMTIKFNNTSNEKIQVLINYTKLPDTRAPEIELPAGFTMDQNTEKTEIIPFKVKPLNVTINNTQKLELQITYSMTSDATEIGGDPIIIKTTRTIQYDPAQEDVLDLAPAFIGIAILFLLLIAFFSFITIRRQ